MPATDDDDINLERLCEKQQRARAAGDAASDGDQKKQAEATEELPGLSPEELAAIDDGAPAPVAPSMRLQAGAAVMSADKAESILDAQIINPLGVIVRGIMASAPGVPADVLFRSIARCYARLIGETFVGDLAPIFTVRASIREAFERELKRQPVKSMPQGHGAPGANGRPAAPLRG